MSATLLLQSDRAALEIRAAAREEVRRALDDVGDPLGRVLDAVAPQLGVLTLGRTADLLGVSPRTVTETYVAELALPAHRVGPTSSPWFVLDEVVGWVRSLSDRGGQGPPSPAAA